MSLRSPGRAGSTGTAALPCAQPGSAPPFLRLRRVHCAKAKSSGCPAVKKAAGTVQIRLKKIRRRIRHTYGHQPRTVPSVMPTMWATLSPRSTVGPGADPSDTRMGPYHLLLFTNNPPPVTRLPGRTDPLGLQPGGAPSARDTGGSSASPGVSPAPAPVPALCRPWGSSPSAGAGQGQHGSPREGDTGPGGHFPAPGSGVRGCWQQEEQPRARSVR